MKKVMKNQKVLVWFGIILLVACPAYTQIPVRPVEKNKAPVQPLPKIRPLVKPLLENPYQNHQYWYKGQVHAHSNLSDGAKSPSKVQDIYRGWGYHFIALTDHYVGHDGYSSLGTLAEKFMCGIFTGCASCAEIHNVKQNPRPGILYIPGMENCDTYPQHLLAIGITRTDSRCGPPCELWPNQFRIDHMAAQGAVSIIAHPYGEYCWDDFELMSYLLGFNGIEINKSKKARQLWDNLLSMGKPVWGFATDDYHDRDNTKGWIVVNSKFGPPEKIFIASTGRPSASEMQLRDQLRKDLINNIMAGNFYAVVRSKGGTSRDIGPKLKKIQDQANVILVETDREDSLISIIGNGGERLDGTKGKSFSYTLTGSEFYVRIEVEQIKDGVSYTAYSQPVFVQNHKVPWAAGVGRLQGTVTGFNGRSLTSPAKMTFSRYDNIPELSGVRLETTESGFYSVRLFPGSYRVTIEPTGIDAYLSGSLSGGPFGVQRLQTKTRDFQLPKATKPPEEGDQKRQPGKRDRDF